MPFASGAYGTVAYDTGPYGGAGSEPPAGEVDPHTDVEVAFTTDPGAAVPTWVALGDFFDGSVNRGRSQELDHFSAGRAMVTLPNEDRRFDPSHTGSPYSPNVLPMRRTRIRSTINGVTYPVFTGYADGWEQTYQHPSVAAAKLAATDGFKVLANIELPGSPYEAELRADAPGHWWRLGEAVGSTSFADSVGTAHLSVVGAPTLATPGLIARDSNASMTITGLLQGATRTGPSTTGGTGPFTVEFVLKSTTGAGQVMVAETDGTGLYGWSVLSFGVFRVNVFPTNGTTVTVDGTTGITTGVTYHVAVTWDAGGTVRLYVNGVLEGTGTVYGSLPNPAAFLVAGGSSGSFTTDGFVGVYDEVAIYPTALSAARIAAHSAAVSNPWNGDLSGARINRLLDAAGWPAAERQIDTGVAVLQSATLGGSALAALQKIEDTEQGRLFVTADGKVRFIDRLSLALPPYTVAQAVFGDSGTELEYADLSYRYDDQTIYNEARVSRLEGTAQVVADAASQAKYLRRSRVLDGLLHRTDQISVDIGNWILAHYKDPLLRVTGMRLEPDAGNYATHYPQVFGRELADRITARRRPQSVGAAIDQEANVEGITHQFSAKRWATNWNLSPAETQVYGVWDDPASLWDTARWSF